MSVIDDWKIVILRRYAAEYPPYAGKGTKILKSSEDIVFDLAGMGEFYTIEVSTYLTVNGYDVEFDDGKPAWILSDPHPDKSLTE